ncbi:MAG: hypothetical protein R2844_05375 [Caldilineales bacterium]
MSALTTELAVTFLEQVHAKEYRANKLPNSTDSQIEEICKFYMEQLPARRQEFVNILGAKARDSLILFADRMTMLSVRKQSPSLLLSGLVALEIGSLPGDWREMLMTLSLFYNSAVKLDLDPERLFHEAVQYTPDQYIAELVLGFPERSPKDKRIEAMGFREIDGPSGLIYRFGQQPVPAGLL